MPLDGLAEVTRNKLIEKYRADYEARAKVPITFDARKQPEGEGSLVLLDDEDFLMAISEHSSIVLCRGYDGGWIEIATKHIGIDQIERIVTDD